MSIKVAKVALTNDEITFASLCLDVFQAFGLDGLLDLARSTPCTHERDEVFFAVAQEIYCSEWNVGPFAVSLECLYSNLSQGFRQRVMSQLPEGIDKSQWNAGETMRRRYVGRFFQGRGYEALAGLGEQLDNSIVRHQRRYYESMVARASSGEFLTGFLGS